MAENQRSERCHGLSVTPGFILLLLPNLLFTWTTSAAPTHCFPPPPATSLSADSFSSFREKVGTTSSHSVSQSPQDQRASLCSFTPLSESQLSDALYHCVTHLINSSLASAQEPHWTQFRLRSTDFLLVFDHISGFLMHNVLLDPNQSGLKSSHCSVEQKL